MAESATINVQDAAIHTSYNPDDPPAHPGPQWTRIVCLSDTHNARFKVPLGDVLIHSGDLTAFGEVGELAAAMEWIYQLPHPQKIVIAGNHDLTLDVELSESNTDFFTTKPDPEAALDLMMGEKARRSRVTYLEYTNTEIQPKRGGRKWKVYGGPGTPWYGGMAFNYERGEDAAAFHAAIPSDTDILVTHGPPQNILDAIHTGEHVGCEQLLERVDQVRPVLHIFGHIHEDRGVHVHEWPSSDTIPANKPHRTIFVNAANAPSGQKARLLRSQGIKISIGGPGFQPIIVDLFDPVRE